MKIPPFKINNSILKLSENIFYEIGVLSGAKLISAPIKLRRGNKIKTIQSSLSIEGNPLTIEQVTAILDGKKVIGKKNDIVEVSNAIKIYQDLSKLNPLSITSFKKSHQILMDGLVKDNGKFRDTAVGIFKGKELAHMPPPAKRVPILMKDLFWFIKKYQDISWLIKACIVHYELEFIHPFSDGNGRVGRLWQQLLLMKENPVFEHIAVEHLIKNNQKVYYDVLGQCDKDGDSTKFIEFSLNHILTAIRQHSASVTPTANDYQSRIEYAQTNLGQIWFSRKNYTDLHKHISNATASRDILSAVEDGILKRSGQKNQVKYQFSKK
jgi:Fic family protein